MSYPAQMQRMLGNGYNVKNFGISARTMMNSGDLPYMNEPYWQDALAFNPDIVIIKLGTNDSKSYNWTPDKKKGFEKDLTTMVKTLKALPSSPKVYLCKPIPAVKDSWTISEKVMIHKSTVCYQWRSINEQYFKSDAADPFPARRKQFR